MKKLFTLLLLAFTISSFAQEVEFIKDDWDQARKLAKETNKPIFVDFYTDWCGWCKVMDKETFANPEVAKYMNENYINLKIDAEIGVGTKMAMKYRVNAFPTFGFFNADGMMITKEAGYQKVDPFMEKLAANKQLAEDGFFLEGISAELDLNFPDFYVKAFKDKNNKKAKKVFPADSVVKKYLDGADLMDEVVFSVATRFKGDEITNSNFIAMRQELIRMYGKTEVKNKLANMLYYQFVPIAKEGDYDKLKAWFPQVDMMMEEESELYKNSYEMRFLSKNKMWDEFGVLIDTLIKKKAISNSNLNSQSWTIYEKVDNKKLVSKAVKWMEKVAKDEPNYMYVDTYAALLYKDKQYALAKENAEKAIKLGKESGDKYEETEKLLKKIKKEMKS